MYVVARVVWNIYSDGSRDENERTIVAWECPREWQP